MPDRHRLHYDFVVTGASGKVALHLIPRLADRGFQILAVGRDVAKLRKQYSTSPTVDVADYEDLTRIPSCHTLIHLAVRNNDQPGRLADFIRDNVGFAENICAEFIRMRGMRFINPSSVHSIAGNVQSKYSISKTIASRKLRDLIGDRFDNPHIGYFYDKGYYGKRLRKLNGLGVLGSAIFGIFKIAKPTTSALSFADYVSTSAPSSSEEVILTEDLAKARAYQIATRGLDIAVAICILIIFLPVFVTLWVVIRVDSSGPAIFTQERVGKGRALFTLYKFRTMKRDTTVAATHEVGATAVTRVGRFLRWSKLDELPQAINILRGEMTLVGPRPCLPVQEELVNAREALGIYTMKPGVTGYSQVREIDMSRPQELARSDYTYMKLQSLALNFKILVATVLGHGTGDRVAQPEKLL